MYEDFKTNVAGHCCFFSLSRGYEMDVMLDDSYKLKLKKSRTYKKHSASVG